MLKARFQIYLALPDPLSFSLVTTFKDEKSKAEISQKPEAVINEVNRRLLFTCRS
jgi:hypothetical protein